MTSPLHKNTDGRPFSDAFCDRVIFEGGKSQYAVFLTDSKNHRIVEAGKGPLKVVWSILPAQAGPPKAS